MTLVYPKRRVNGRKIVTQCNKAGCRKAAIQNARFPTSTAYNLVVEWALQ